jgi:ubiquinone/menaquinone biosynthesis C-methylase UbiE
MVYVCLVDRQAVDTMREQTQETLAGAIAPKTSPPSFELQAPEYEQRVGFPAAIGRQIADRAIAIAQAQPDDLIVEVGAGTGTIGKWFVQSPLHYLGFDLSPAMLTVFRQQLDPAADNWQLLVADGNQTWPVADGTAKIIFGSRSIHLLEIERAIAEIGRVSHPAGATLLIGSVQRQKDSVKWLMKQEMQRLLKQRGFHPRQGDKSQRQIIDLFCQQGAEMIEPAIAAQWTVTTSPQDSLQNWQQKAGLGGIDLPHALQQEILTELQAWAADNFSHLHQPIATTETYLLQGVYLPTHF